MLAQEWKVKLYILHILDTKDEKGLEIKTKDIEAQIHEELPKSKTEVEILVAAGEIADSITEIASQRGCGLIVTGVARYDSVGDIFLGNPVDQLVQYARHPVLIVKQRPMRNYKNIIIATDFSDCSLYALNTAADLFPYPTLHLVHAYQPPSQTWLKSEQGVSDVPSEQQRLMDRFLAKTAISDTVFDRLNASIEEGDLAQVLLDRIDKTKSDLVVLGAHGRSGFTQATIGHNAKTILGCARQDVLLVREPK